jgi:hypothetical protein
MIKSRRMRQVGYSEHIAEMRSAFTMLENLLRRGHFKGLGYKMGALY